MCGIVCRLRRHKCTGCDRLDDKRDAVGGFGAVNAEELAHRPLDEIDAHAHGHDRRVYDER